MRLPSPAEGGASYLGCWGGESGVGWHKTVLSEQVDYVAAATRCLQRELARRRGERQGWAVANGGTESVDGCRLRGDSGEGHGDEVGAQGATMTRGPRSKGTGMDVAARQSSMQNAASTLSRRQRLRGWRGGYGTRRPSVFLFFAVLCWVLLGKYPARYLRAPYCSTTLLSQSFVSVKARLNGRTLYT